MSDLLQEVDEMMRQERLEKFWRENGNYVIGFIVLLILGTAGWSGYQSWSEHVRTEQTALLIEALEDEKFYESVDELAGKLNADLKTVALLTAAGQALENENTEKALEHYRAIAVNGSASGELYGLAVIMSARLAEGDKKLAQLPSLQKIAGDQSSPWRFHAFVEAAVIEATYNRDYARARTYLENVVNPPQSSLAIPAGLSERARSLDHVYKLLEQQSNQQKQEG